MRGVYGSFGSVSKRGKGQSMKKKKSLNCCAEMRKMGYEREDAEIDVEDV